MKSDAAPSRKSPKIIASIQELRNWRKNQPGSVGFVPTMGALHEGHATLLREARQRCDSVVLSIFVNPTQFGPHEDLARYPRQLERDAHLAEHEGVDVIFTPSAEMIYPEGYSTYIEENSLSLPLCGVFRPGHFRGVTTVVLKLFHIVQPDSAFFGLKDAQQFFVLKKMVEDLHIEVEMIGIPTVREADGLAMSSRNVYLSADQRKTAPELYRVLCSLKKDLMERRETPSFRAEWVPPVPRVGVQTPTRPSSTRDFSPGLMESQSPPWANPKIQKAQQELSKYGFQVQYLEWIDLARFESATHYQEDHSYLLAVAAHLDQVRLIDNVIF